MPCLFQFVRWENGPLRRAGNCDVAVWWNRCLMRRNVVPSYSCDLTPFCREPCNNARYFSRSHKAISLYRKKEDLPIHRRRKQSHSESNLIGDKKLIATWNAVCPLLPARLTPLDIIGQNPQIKECRDLFNTYRGPRIQFKHCSHNWYQYKIIKITVTQSSNIL